MCWGRGVLGAGQGGVEAAPPSQNLTARFSFPRPELPVAPREVRSTKARFPLCTSVGPLVIYAFTHMY